LWPLSQPIPRFSRDAEAEAMGRAVAKSASDARKIKILLEYCILVDRV
jgi:hypothetical protein